MENLLMDSYMPVRIFSGRDCIQRNAGVFADAGRSCLVVTGGQSAVRSGALDDLTASLQGVGVAYRIFDGIGQNPETAVCYAAGKLAREMGADFIVGVGGGSPQDAAKAVAIFAADGDMTTASIYTRKIPARRLPLFLVGTTAGTGSEVTGVSVLTNEAGYKKSISGADCYARAAFCTARYTESMPYAVTVSTALDAYAHALESFLVSTANALSVLYAEKALSLLWGRLRELARKPGVLPDADGREALYAASVYAGLAINITGTAFPHTTGYILTECCGIPHGRACTAFHPTLLRNAQEFCPEKLADVCALLDTDPAGINRLVGELTAVRLDISREQATRFCERWTAGVKNFDRSPGGFTPAQAVEALLELSY